MTFINLNSVTEIFKKKIKKINYLLNANLFITQCCFTSLQNRDSQSFLFPLMMLYLGWHKARSMEQLVRIELTSNDFQYRF